MALPLQLCCLNHTPLLGWFHALYGPLLDRYPSALIAPISLGLHWTPGITSSNDLTKPPTLPGPLPNDSPLKLYLASAVSFSCAERSQNPFILAYPLPQKPTPLDDTVKFHCQLEMDPVPNLHPQNYSSSSFFTLLLSRDWWFPRHSAK